MSSTRVISPVQITSGYVRREKENLTSFRMINTFEWRSKIKNEIKKTDNFAHLMHAYIIYIYTFRIIRKNTFCPYIHVYTFMMRIYTRPYNYKYTVCCAHRLTFSPIVSRLAKTETGVENVFAKIANSTRVTKWYNRKKKIKKWTRPETTIIISEKNR